MGSLPSVSEKRRPVRGFLRAGVRRRRRSGVGGRLADGGLLGWAAASCNVWFVTAASAGAGAGAATASVADGGWTGTGAGAGAGAATWAGGGGGAALAAGRKKFCVGGLAATARAGAGAWLTTCGT